MDQKLSQNTERKKIDWMITLVPLTLIVLLCVLFFCMPERCGGVLALR